MARFAVRTKLRVGKQTYSYLDIFVGGFEIDARERSFPRTDHRVKS